MEDKDVKCQRCRKPKWLDEMAPKPRNLSGKSGTCIMCMSQINAWRYKKKKEEEALRVKDPTDGCCWPATLNPLLAVKKF